MISRLIQNGLYFIQTSITTNSSAPQPPRVKQNFLRPQPEQRLPIYAVRSDFYKTLAVQPTDFQGCSVHQTPLSSPAPNIDLRSAPRNPTHRYLANTPLAQEGPTTHHTRKPLSRYTHVTINDRGGMKHSASISRETINQLKTELIKAGTSAELIKEQLLCFPNEEDCLIMRLYLDNSSDHQALFSSAQETGDALALKVTTSQSGDYISFGYLDKGDALADFANREKLAIADILKFGDSPFGADRTLLVPPNNHDVSQVDPRLGFSGYELTLSIIGGTPSIKALAADYDGTLADGYLNKNTAEQLLNQLKSGTKIAIITANEPDNILNSLSSALSSSMLTNEHCQNIRIYFYCGNLQWNGFTLKNELKRFEKTDNEAHR